VENAEKNTNLPSPLLKELIDGLETSNKYEHLRIILTKNDIGSFGQNFLMVTTSAFGVVKLLNLIVDDARIYLELQDIDTGIINKVPLDVNDVTFKFLLISWDDIITMTLKDRSGEGSLLEFDY
jgi:hypothetical protein